MELERIDLREFLATTLELLADVMPDEIVFTCQFADAPAIEADRCELRELVTTLVVNACKAFEDGSGEVQLRIGTVSGRSGPHAFIEVSRPATGARITLPLATIRPQTVRVAPVEPARSQG
jgi:signal transduction histidine kinase